MKILNTIKELYGMEGTIQAIADKYGCQLEYRRPKELTHDYLLDFDIILVRLDLGMRVYDPAESRSTPWVQPRDWLKGGNYAVHFGVGYPF